MSDKKSICFTWGGGEGYDVFLRFEGCSLSPIYELVVPGIKSCFAAQQIVQRGNAALKNWMPQLLAELAELPGVGFQYSAPEAKLGVRGPAK